MLPQTGNTLNNVLPYSQLTQYGISTPYSTAQSGIAPGGKTLQTIVGVIAAGILIGMCLGLGLGIGAAGILSDLQLINVTNATTTT